MIATLDRLMALSQKVRDAERTSEREPIYVALELNEVRLIERMIESYLGELDPYAHSGVDDQRNHGCASSSLTDEY